MAHIFISYRRAESHAVTDRIYDHLSAQFGAHVIFKDVDSIPMGEQFPVAITEAIIRCEVVLVIIGPSWATITNESGKPRLHEPDDFVRQEVETALRHNKRVIPVLVEDAKMPAPDSLPPSLRPLTERNAVKIRHDPYFREDIARLTSGIAKSLGPRDTPNWMRRVNRRILAGVVLVLIIIVALLFTSRGNSESDGNSSLVGGEHGQVQIIERGGGVFFLPANNSGKNHGVDDGQWISSGGTLTTFEDTVVRVNFALSAFSTVMPSAWVQLNNIVDTSTPMGFTIENSEIFVFTGEWPGAVVNTINGSRATVTGSEMWMTDDQGTITTACFSGSCTVSDSTNQTQNLNAGFMVTFDSQGGDLLPSTYSPQPIPRSNISAYNSRCGACIPVTSTPPPVPGRVVFTTSGFLLETDDFFAANTDGSDIVVLKQPDIELLSPMWSPDGSQIAFVGRDESEEPSTRQIYTLDADGSNLTRLTNLESSVTGMDWSPDGTQIVFSARELFIIDVDGSNLEQLTDSLDFYDLPAWSPDGNLIAFTFGARGSGSPDIVVMELDGWPRLNLTLAKDSFDGYPVWSPDGSQIAFVSERDGNAEIYVMNADGTDPVNLTQNEAKDEHPVWLPDGQHIAFISNRDQIDPKVGQNAYVMNADGSDVVQILDFWLEPPYPPGYDYVNYITYLDWQPSDINVVQQLEPKYIAPDALNAELAWRVASPERWRGGGSLTSGNLDVSVMLPDDACTISATYYRRVGYSIDADTQSVSADNVTYDAQTDTYVVIIPDGYVSECKPVEAELEEQTASCPNPPDVDALARAQALLTKLESLDEELTEFKNELADDIEASLSRYTGESNVVVVFDETLSPELPESCVAEIPDGWQYDVESGIWEPVEAN